MALSLPSLAFHGLGLAILSYPFDFIRRMETQVSQGFGGRLSYLTILGWFTVWMTFALALACNIISNSALATAKRGMMVFGFPLQFIITLFYWTLYLIDPYLLHHSDDPAIDMLMDCALHLFPGLLISIELFVFNPSFKRSNHHLMGLMLFAFGYGAWLQLCFHMNGFWVYPFLRQFDHMQRLAFYTVSGILACGAYQLSTFIHQRIYSDAIKIKKN